MIQVYLYLVLVFIVVLMLNIYYSYLIDYRKRIIEEHKKKLLDEKNKTEPCFLNKCDENYRFCPSNDQHKSNNQ